MSLLLITLVSLSVLGAVYSGYLGFKSYRKITVTSENVTFPKILRVSIQYGLASTLIFFAFVMTAGIFDPDYQWSSRSFASSLIVSMIAGVITVLGSLYQVYTTIKYRGLISRILKKKD